MLTTKCYEGFGLMRYVLTILRVCLDTRSAWFPRAVIIHVNRVRIDSFVCFAVRLSSGAPANQLKCDKGEGGGPLSLKKRERRISVIDIEMSRLG